MTIPTHAARPVSDAERQAALTAAVHEQVARGGRVEQQAQFSALVRFGRPRSAGGDVIHFILTLLTLGAWLLVWLLSAFLEQRQRHVIALVVDEHGVVRQREIARGRRA